jgi:hypothetical protein
VAEEKLRSLSNTAADSVWRLVVSEREHREQFEELSLLQARGSEMCLAIVGPPRVRNHLSVGMRAAAFHHTKRVGELAAPLAAVSSVAGSMLGCSPTETSRVEVMDELVAEFWRLEELCSWLEGPSVRICDPLLGPPLDQAQWADRLDEATMQLGVELVAW